MTIRKGLYMKHMQSIERIPLSEICIEPYQRVLNNARVKRIADNFDQARVGVLFLSKRGPHSYAIVDGQHYLVSMLGQNAQWVLNVRAAHGKAAVLSGGRREVLLEEVPAAQCAPIIKAYLQRAPGARPHVPVSKDAPVAEFEKIAADFPVFRIQYQP